jgi:hypothetical protein
MGDKLLFRHMVMLGGFLTSVAWGAMPTSNQVKDAREYLDRNVAQVRAWYAKLETDIKDNEARLGEATPFMCQGRLTLVSGTPIPTTDQSGKSTVYFTPYMGSRIALYSGTVWEFFSFTEFSITLSGLTTNKNYDVFAYSNAGTPTLELTAWTSDTARATALTTQDGVLVKTGALTRRYLGTIRATAANQTQDTAAQRFVWNHYNRSWRSLQRTYSTGSWTYAAQAYRAVNSTNANRVEYVVGYAESLTPIRSLALETATTYNLDQGNAMGLDSTTAASTGVMRGQVCDNSMTNISWSEGVEYASLGYHYIQWLESANAGGTTTFYSAPDARVQGGMLGMIEG